MRALLNAWGWLWAAPLHVLALLALPIYEPVRWRWRAGKVDIWVKRALGMPGGQTLGQITFWLVENPPPGLILHEDTHTLQCWIFGPLMFALYPLGLTIGVILGQWHDRNPLEYWAYRVSGVR